VGLLCILKNIEISSGVALLAVHFIFSWLANQAYWHDQFETLALLQ
jgi:hypothetical protein